MPRSRQGMQGLTPSTATVQTVSYSTSPYTYANSTQGIQSVQVSGGAVSLIELLDKSGTATTIGSSSLGLLSGTFILQPGYSIRVTWAVTKPTIIVY